MNSFEAYKKYVALKLHFQSADYDYFKFSGGVKLSRQKFETRNDRYFFDRICKIYDDKQFEGLLVSNFIRKKDAWVGDVLSEEGRSVYLDWKKKQQALEYEFKEELLRIRELIVEKKIESFDALFHTPSDGNWPIIVELALHKTISLETFLIMNKVLNFITKIDAQINDEIVWPEFRTLCKKYSPFLSVDAARCKSIMRRIFVDNDD